MGYTDEDLEELWRKAELADIIDSYEYINLIRNASLADRFSTSTLSPEALDRLKNPRRGPPPLADADLELSMKMFFTNITEDAYAQIAQAIRQREPNVKVYTHHQVKKHIENLSGVEPIWSDMCINSCVGYTGKNFDLEKCPRCFEPRYDPVQSRIAKKKVPQQRFVTLLLGLQLQSFFATLEHAELMQYRVLKTEQNLHRVDVEGRPIEVFEDVFNGKQYLDAVRRGDIKPGDPVLMFSIDGAQLYASKQSDVWIYIWVIFDVPPSHRYKKAYVLPGAVIPGPRKPKHLESFLFPGFHHLSAIQRDGLGLWDPRLDTTYISHPYLHIGTADGPGMAFLCGLSGHHGRMACRLLCGTPGRHPDGSGHYYPMLQQPTFPPGLIVPNSMHEDLDVRTLPKAGDGDYNTIIERITECRTNAQYESVRRDTGITRPCIFLGLPRDHLLPVPHCFGSDCMHLWTFNVGDELIPLWHGEFSVKAPDSRNGWTWGALMDKDEWAKHGQLVANATPFLPGSFDRPPRNPAEKIHSGYKAWEYYLYLYGICTSILFGVLEDRFYKNFVELVGAVRILGQFRITLQQLDEAQEKIYNFVEGFEREYVDRLPERIHFVRPWIHVLTHHVEETKNKGPPICSSQWTMERMIGSLGQELRSHQSPYANLAQRAVLRSQMNALSKMYTFLGVEDPVNKLPMGSLDLGNGYVLLPKREKSPKNVSTAAGIAIHLAMEERGIESVRRPRILKWARLRLPNGQVARSVFKEATMNVARGIRMARNIKITLENETRFAEVQYYFQADEDQTFALVSLYSQHDEHLYRESLGTSIACEYHGERELRVIPVEDIKSVVALVLHKFPHKETPSFYLIEKPGLEIAVLTGVGHDELAEIDDDAT
ncbi:hypothetical protein CONPUDRAFT_54837 [Coniophora puteana RWD-64-598 SS2]|uniref:Uncharacterized protein n=1 Tax=Coniophora puteana (strain RWD-64-598) TaxID=741705 RepID=A0A5M3MRK8_CONPW|nr:uncharacterized protein CONPUDRAFT_54837 [Coniophora puteana RWD-64-598 SS2]EIW81720.1 hypothetical protein CONPUDRAFT_54837 [Coniophora puteana RWD-64-598 SS2]